MKLNIKQWNAVLDCLKEAQQAREAAYTLAAKLQDEKEKEYSAAYAREDWQAVDELRPVCDEYEKLRRAAVDKLNEIEGIIQALENQDL